MGFYAVKHEIYDGDWSNDRRQGEGSILNADGQISSGDFRADQMEGKLQHQKTLSKAETERIFSLIITQRDAFIAVDNKPKNLGSSRQSLNKTARPTTQMFPNSSSKR